jgi:hypothetical protein
VTGRRAVRLAVIGAAWSLALAGCLRVALSGWPVTLAACGALLVARALAAWAARKVPG